MNLLGMFARHPVPGKVKTRLAASIGDPFASMLYSAFVEDLLSRCAPLADQFIVAATPESEAASDWFSARIRDATKLIYQPDGDLGDRISWFFQRAHEMGSERTVLIGSDSPDIPTAIIESAFRVLSESQMVVAPATDGGFVLIGLRQPAKNLFENIGWSSGTTLIDTLRSAEASRLTVQLLQPWYDIDTVHNLGTLIALQQGVDSGAANCPGTRAALQLMKPTIEECLKQI